MSEYGDGATKFLEKIHHLYDKDNKMSLSETLNKFRQITESFNEFSKEEESNIKHYSANNFLDCSTTEQDDIVNEQLQFVECLVTNSIYDKQGIIWNWHDIYKLLYDANYSKIEKIHRKVVYSTSSNNRPIGDTSFDTWNGLQIIDLDVKNAELCKILKQKIFDELYKYQWFLGICVSASGKGLHVWTKITPLSVNPSNKRIEYICNFRHKYSYVYISLAKYAKDLGYTKENIIEYMDMAMSKPQQGIFISSDNAAMLNANFRDVRLDVNFESAFNTGVESINWITHPDLTLIFRKLEWFMNDKFDNTTNVSISNIENIQDRDTTKSLGKRHYKHAQRWQLANTLTNIFGEDKALSIMLEICDNTPLSELKGDIKTAAIHSKPISIWAVKELNKQHGFNIKINSSEANKDNISKIEDEINSTESIIDPTKILNDNLGHVDLKLTTKQYLSDIKDDIIKNLSHITLLEAGAGYGKTEMIKSLKARTLLILPFTSTIKAKVESSETTKDWLYFYGNKRPTLDDLMSGKNISMTIDKFSRLNVIELDQSNFDYIVIDESHLLFTSSYRDVMSPTVQRLANCKAKTIMMTGTPTGEMLFFPNIKHIKVTKEDCRDKEFTIRMCETSTEQLIEMCKSMAKDIISGKKILYPTNKGNMYYGQVVGIIQQYLDLENFGKELKAFYYKKSNYGEKTMDEINIDKSIGDKDIIFCTTYLSVGVDICDKYEFSVYFNELYIGQDIEQFANRLRNNNLYINMFLPRVDSNNIPINYYTSKDLDLSINEKDLLFSRDLAKTCNDMIERNEEESKYNPMISSILATHAWLKYDENDCKYYIDETTYKLKVFEERYSEYAKQLPVLVQSMKYYGYTVDILNIDNKISEDRVDEVEEYLKSCRRVRFNYMTTQTMKFLDHINDANIDIYKELLKGSYEIFKDDEYKEERENNNLYVEDIEILERNIPIVVGLYKIYDCETIKEIYKYCTDSKQNRINFTKLARIKKFINIELSRKKKRLDFPIKKFIKDAQKFATDNPSIEDTKIVQWLANYSAKYANTVKDVVVQDTEYLENIFELIKELWSTVIIQSRIKKSTGTRNIEPFTLLWEQKNSLENIYGDKNTKIFFDDLLDNMKDINIDDDDEELPDLPHTPKKSIEEIRPELPNVIHKQFNYFEYSKLDNSNNRFMKKQENTNSLRDTLFNNIDDNIEDTKNKDIEQNLFINDDGD